MDNNKVKLSRQLVTADTQKVYKNVVELIIQNYSDDKIDISLSGIRTEIPKAIKVEGIDVPSLPYRISAEGNILEEVSFEIYFVPGSTKKVIIDCTSIKC